MRTISPMSDLPLRLGAVLVLAFLTAGCAPMPPTGPKRGAVLYDACSVCHGTDGGGRPELRVPAIAGLPAWYVSSQLTKFNEGWRAYHVDDYDGIRMRPMLLSLQETNPDGTVDRTGTAVNIDAVARYVARLPPVEPDAVVEGDAQAGGITYATCSACHGPDGLGNQELGAPPVVQLDDWYVVSSLQQYKQGRRGRHPDDMIGATMAAIGVTLPDEKAMRDVAAYIRSLRPQQEMVGQ